MSLDLGNAVTPQPHLLSESGSLAPTYRTGIAPIPPLQETVSAESTCGSTIATSGQWYWQKQEEQNARKQWKHLGELYLEPSGLARRRCALCLARIEPGYQEKELYFLPVYQELVLKKRTVHFAEPCILIVCGGCEKREKLGLPDFYKIIHQSDWPELLSRSSRTSLSMQMVKALFFHQCYYLIQLCALCNHEGEDKPESQRVQLQLLLQVFSQFFTLPEVTETSAHPARSSHSLTQMGMKIRAMLQEQQTSVPQSLRALPPAHSAHV